MLSDDELAETWATYFERRDPESLDLLVRQYTRLATFFARKALARAPAHQDPEEIISYAHDGLVKAIMAFDPTAGAKFETYATRRIPGAIIDGQRAQDPLARSTRKKVKLLGSAIDELWEKLQRDPTLGEIAESMGESVDDVKLLLLARQSLNGSIDQEAGVLETRGLHDDAEVESQLAEVRAVMAGRLALLSPQQRAFVLRYYVDDANLKTTAADMGIQSEWARRIRNGVLEAITR